MRFKKSKDLISQLVEDLTPKPRLAAPAVRSMSWLLPAYIIVFSIMWYVQPFRISFLEQVTSAPSFSLEILFGYLTAILAIVTSFTMAVPGNKEQRLLKFFTVFSLFIWATIFFWNYFSPSLEAFMNVKRAACVYETSLYGILLAATLIFFHNRSAFFDRGKATIYIGLGCGAIPAVTMQVACIHEPQHGLIYHFAPVVLVLFVTFFLGKSFLPKI